MRHQLGMEAGRNPADHTLHAFMLECIMELQASVKKDLSLSAGARDRNIQQCHVLEPAHQMKNNNS